MVKVWDTRTGQAQLTLAGHTRTVRGVCASADGRHVVAGDHGGQVYFLRLRSRDD